MKRKQDVLITIILFCVILVLVFICLFFYNNKANDFTVSKSIEMIIVPGDLTYNDVVKSMEKCGALNGFCETKYQGNEIEWQGKISAYHSQITGIKFCVIDDEHQDVNINKPCDMFWAFADELMDADIIAINPSWDGQWVKYILNYYNVPFDENSDYYNDVYTVNGTINGIDCAPTDKCSPDIEIINIIKE